MADLLLKRATASPGEVYDVMCEERIVGRIMLSADAQFPWVWKIGHPRTAMRLPARHRCRRSRRAGRGGGGGGRPTRQAGPTSACPSPRVRDNRRPPGWLR